MDWFVWIIFLGMTIAMTTPVCLGRGAWTLTIVIAYALNIIAIVIFRQPYWVITIFFIGAVPGLYGHHKKVKSSCGFAMFLIGAVMAIIITSFIPSHLSLLTQPILKF